MTGACLRAARELFATGGRRSRRGGDVRGDGVGHGAVGADHDQRERTVVPRKVWRNDVVNRCPKFAMISKRRVPILPARWWWGGGRKMPPPPTTSTRRGRGGEGDCDRHHPRRPTTMTAMMTVVAVDLYHSNNLGRTSAGCLNPASWGRARAARAPRCVGSPPPSGRAGEAVSAATENVKMAPTMTTTTTAMATEDVLLGAAPGGWVGGGA